MQPEVVIRKNSTVKLSRPTFLISKTLYRYPYGYLGRPKPTGKDEASPYEDNVSTRIVKISSGYPDS